MFDYLWFVIPKKCIHLFFKLFYHRLWGFCHDDSAYISLRSANVLTTIIFPCKVSLLCCHCFSTTSNCFSFGSRFSLTISSLFVQKNIQRAFASLEDHTNCFLLKNVILVFFKDQIRNT